jgi:hypothetical protein
VGARNHCVHGKDLIPEVILDWQPFEYFTVEQDFNGLGLTITHHLEPLPDGETRWQTLFKIKLPLPAALAGLEPAVVVKASPAMNWHPNLQRMLEDEFGNGDSGAALDPAIGA